MSDRHSSAPNRNSRRELLGSALLGVGVAASWRVGLGEAIANARLTGKPLLSAVSISRLLSTREGLLSFRADPKGFVREHFSLTVAQQRALDAATTEEVAAVRKAADRALHANATLVCRNDCGAGELKAAAVNVASQSGRFRFVKTSAESAGQVEMYVAGFGP